MTPASPAGVASSSSSKVRVLLLLLAACVMCVGPYASWRVFVLLWPLRWTILASIAAVEACFYRYVRSVCGGGVCTQTLVQVNVGAAS
jgi:hypothetical protein